MNDEMELSDSDLDEYLNSSESADEAEGDKIPFSGEKEILSLTPEEFIKRRAHVSTIGQEVLIALPGAPETFTEKLLYNFYYAIQFVIIFNKLDGNKPVIDHANDSDTIIREKVYVIHLDSCYRDFLKMVELLSNNVYSLIRSKAGTEERIQYIFDQITRYKELHSRRIKSDPAASRTKTDKVQKTINIITNEQYDHENVDHKSWRMLIFNPLPSDFDTNAIDPKEGGKSHALAIEVEKLKGKYHVPDPFYVVVTTEWDKIFRLIHSLVHFEEYMHTYIIGAVDIEAIKDMNWKDTWDYLFKEHVSVPIKNLSREKKKTPQIVSRTAELRDFLECAISFLK